MGKIIYQGAWTDPERTYDADGEPFKPNMTVTKEVNGYLVWMRTPNGYAKPDFYYDRNEAIESAVGRVQRHRAEMGE